MARKSKHETSRPPSPPEAKESKLCLIPHPVPIVGRPSKYDPAMCETALEVLAAGGTLSQVCAQLGICKVTLLEWKQKRQDFADAIRRGEELSAAWWDRMGQMNLHSSVFNLGLYVFMRANLHKWSRVDKVDGMLNIDRAGSVHVHFDREDAKL